MEAPLAPFAPAPQADHAHHSAMSPEEFICRIMEAEPPEIYLMEELKKPFTEASMMMSLTNLADRELVLMISWAKKIPGSTGETPARSRTKTEITSLKSNDEKLLIGDSTS
ncbi:hypothetical protein F2P81_003369 [Scophthalmus maximus]|uniref:NR LBD domain-containing protein n=1 Tax=Scophthalmus maximus TaxID=52904 RepID=A0A6A4TN62_SCOMX|nr:hypothetical protein F2P81_003369 [Scophthalmus maximus]